MPHSTCFAKLTKPVTKVQSSLKRAEHKVHDTLATQVWKNGMRIGLVAHLFFTKKLSTAYLAYTDLIWVRVLVALLIVYLAYIDIISSALLGAVFILSVQELHSRKSALALTHMTVPNTAGLSGMLDKQLHLSVAMGQKTSGPGAEDAESIVKAQIGMLDVGPQIFNPLIDDAVQPGTQYIKVNMGQHDSMDMLVNNQPASKTLAENIKLSNTGFITPKNLVDAQINSAQGADMVDAPCAVESIAGSYNAQGLGMPMPLAGDRCQFSAV